MRPQASRRGALGEGRGTSQNSSIQREAVTAVMHGRILAMLRDRYDRPIMNNVSRGDYVERMIVTALGADWRLTWAGEWDWSYGREWVTG